MAEIVNLRMARKARDRRTAEQAAAQNRTRFGETRAAREIRKAETARTERDLAGKKRDESEGTD